LRLFFRSFSCHRASLRAPYAAIGAVRCRAACFPFRVDHIPLSIQPEMF
jgi:hypothetical protein